MILPAPNLDDRDFDELLRELQQLIPTYTPELAIGERDWTDWNDSEPGTTLLQLWAHLAETILFRLNRLPDRAYVKFLELVGLRLRPARPATAHLTFTPQAGYSPPIAGAGITVPARTAVRAQPAGGGDPLTFETDIGLDLVRVELASVQVRDGGTFHNVTDQNGPEGGTLHPFGWQPQPDNALYLGFAPPDRPVAGRLFPAAVRLRVFLPPDRSRTTSSDRPTAAEVSPVQLVWEYRRRAADAPWRSLQTFEDETAGFTRDGYILIEGPRDIEPVGGIGKEAEPRLWLRCRLAGGNYPERAPIVDLLRTNTVAARSLATVRDEVVGESEGHPDQSFGLRHAPMQPDSLVLEVEEERGEFAPWQRQDDLLASSRDARHYTVDGASGTITFGDGRRGRIPLAGARIVAREYRHGATAAANVGAGLVNALATSVPGVQAVTNLRPAVGGADVQNIEDLKRRAPAELRTLQRAVTAEDYEALAGQVGTVARVKALPLTHPRHRGVEVPGSVTVIVIPEAPATDPAPNPSAALREEVLRHLDAARTLATELHVTGPRYRRIRVVAQVAAETSASFDTVRLAAVGALNAYLDPLGRAPQPLPGQTHADVPTPDERWEFGEDLQITNLFGVLLRVPGVVAVPRLSVEVDGAPWDRTAEPVVLDPDGLFFGADHEIAVVARRDLTTASVP